MVEHISRLPAGQSVDRATHRCADLTIGVLDTSVATENTGDFIIMEAAIRQIDECLPWARRVHLATHERLGLTSYRLQRKAAWNFACGTNLLHSHMLLVKQWNVGILSALLMKPIVLLGVGWRSQAKRRTGPYTRWLLRALLSRNYMHAVRDSYTESRLREIGFDNVLTTACPTMWSLTPEHCRQIQSSQGESVIMTVTDYSRDPDADRRLVEVLKKSYRTVYVWCQGAGDYQYLKSLTDVGMVEVLPPSLRAYDDLLQDASLSLDYVGTRLHAGIRALQCKRRTLIIGVDHRSLAKQRDFQLPVLDRYLSAHDLERAIRTALPCQIAIPAANIWKWKSQFRSETVC
jgi:hypothetical protein